MSPKSRETALDPETQAGIRRVLFSRYIIAEVVLLPCRCFPLSHLETK